MNRRTSSFFLLLVKGVDVTWEGFFAFGVSGWNTNWVRLLSQKKSVFCGGEQIWETLWTSGECSSDTLDVFSRAEEFVLKNFVQNAHSKFFSF